MAPVLKTAEELQIMREAGRIVALAHEEMRRAIKPGISTKALDEIATTVLRDHNAEPAFLGYAPGHHPPYPATITASINASWSTAFRPPRDYCKRAILLA